MKVSNLSIIIRDVTEGFFFRGPGYVSINILSCQEMQLGQEGHAKSCVCDFFCYQRIANEKTCVRRILTHDIQVTGSLKILSITSVCFNILGGAAMYNKFSDPAIGNNFIFLAFENFCAVFEPFHLSILSGYFTLQYCSGFLFDRLVLKRLSEFNWGF